MKQYKLALFDMDGVMTKENCYWKAAAMTVWEMIYRDRPGEMLCRTEEIYNTVFCGSEVIHAAKEAGVNTNYDMAYVVTALAYSFRNTEEPFLHVLAFFREQERLVPLLYQQCGEAAGGGSWYYGGEKWEQIRKLFRDWYLGDGAERPGFVHREQPLFPPEQLKAFLTRLQKAGVAAGIGTGRFRNEIVPHLKRWGISDLFDPERIVTQTEVFQAQEEAKKNGMDLSLSKPHFYIFGKGVAGLSEDDMAVLHRSFDPTLLNQTLVVGDAGADLYSARSLGADFAAVLTGVAGAAERPFFEAEKATYIADDIFGLLPILEGGKGE